MAQHATSGRTAVASAMRVVFFAFGLTVPQEIASLT